MSSINKCERNDTGTGETVFKRRMFRGSLETSLPVPWFFEISSVCIHFWNGSLTDYTSLSLALDFTHDCSQLLPVRQREIRDHNSKWTLHAALNLTSNFRSNLVAFYGHPGNNTTSEKCPTPKYFTWTVMHVCVENTARSPTSRSFPFREYIA